MITERDAEAGCHEQAFEVGTDLWFLPSRRIEQESRRHKLESINDARLGCIVRRHFHFHSITNGKANETFAHLSGNVRENHTLIGKCDAEHSSWKHHHDGTLQYDRLLRIHDRGGFVGRSL
jgi:hypothetical protein